MQINTLSIQLGLGSSVVDWYKDATSVPFGHLLIDLSPRTDDRIRYCTNSGKTPSKFYVPENLKHLTTLDDEPTKSLYSSCVLIISLVDKFLASPRIKLSLSNTIVLDGTDTGVLLQNFAQHSRRKNADVPDTYFTLLDAADISPSKVLNQNAKAKERGNWIPFKI